MDRSTMVRLGILLVVIGTVAQTDCSTTSRPCLRLRGGNQILESPSTKDGLRITYSLPEKQRDAFDEIFNRVKPVDEDAAGPYKVVVYDSHWRDIFALSLSPLDLHFYGVPMHVHINTPNRSGAPVPAVYFLRPKPENFEAVAEDANSDMYECAYVHVSGPTNVTQWDPMNAPKDKIKSACDIHCDFLSLDDDTFELGIRDCYFRLHQPKLSDSVPQLLDSIADGLFNVLITCDLRPIIRAQRGTAAEEVGHRLLQRMKAAIIKDSKAFDDPHVACSSSAFQSSSSLSSSSSSSSSSSGRAAPSRPGAGRRHQRPLLLLFDRSHDLPLMLHHACSYNALLHDCLGMHVNTVSLPAPPKKKRPPPEEKGVNASAAAAGGQGEQAAEEGPPAMTVPLDAREDPFWRDTAELPLPNAVAELERRLALKAAPEEEEEEADADQESLRPEAERAFQKRVMELHTKLVSRLADQVADRALDDFFEVESRILSAPATTDIDAVEDLLGGYRVQVGEEREATKSSREDRMRLFLMLYLRCNLDDELLSHLFKYLSKLGCDMRVFAHLGALKTRQHSASFGRRSNIVAGLLSAGADRLKMLTRDRKPGATAVSARGLLGLEAEGGEAEAAEAAEFSMVDLWDEESDKEFDHVMVFMVGGGSFVERDDVRATLNACGHPVVYGATDMVSPEQMLRQLSESAEAPK